jgi:hypothetical protein
LNCTISGLMSGTTYTICVVASNAVAHSHSACTSVTTSSSGAPSPSVSVWKSSSASDHCGGCYWIGVQVHNFPMGTFAFACFDRPALRRGIAAPSRLATVTRPGVRDFAMTHTPMHRTSL